MATSCSPLADAGVEVSPTVMLDVLSNVPVDTTHRSKVDPSAKEYSSLSIPTVTAGYVVR